MPTYQIPLDALLALLAVVAAGALLAGIQGYEMFSRAVAYAGTPISPRDIQEGEWQVLSHTLNAKLDLSTGMIIGTSTLELHRVNPTPLDHILLRLNPGIETTEVREDDNAPLPFERLGDSVQITLPGVEAGDIFLSLAWHGAPRLAFADFHQTGGSGFRPPVESLITPKVGYLLRDGDWYPWPWTAEAHQAANSHLTLELTGSQTQKDQLITTAPVNDGKVTWIGSLPDLLLVIPPPHKSTSSSGGTIYSGEFVNSLSMGELASYSALAPRMWGLLGSEPTPNKVIVLPYLPGIMWVGEQLLVPENRYPPAPGLREQSVSLDLAQSWLLAYTPRTSKLMYYPPNDPNGRWIKITEYGDEGVQETIAILQSWIAAEVIVPDIQGSEAFPDSEWVGNQQYKPAFDTLMTWTQKVGRERALHVVGEVVQTKGIRSIQEMFADFGHLSGVLIADLWHSLDVQIDSLDLGQSYLRCSSGLQEMKLSEPGAGCNGTRERAKDNHVSRA